MVHSKDEKETRTHPHQGLLPATRDPNRALCRHRFRPVHHWDTYEISQYLTYDLEHLVGVTQEGMAQ